ncbi:MAG: type II toxin-antitoxin system RelE/ParE family toxin [Leptospiraceae bacterium]|nr:type II toxin-antitoxin system RelE/ParE family toxin [Leptospiraceae bacterium]
MKFEFHPDALMEYESAIDYHLQISKKLANLFVNEMEDKINKILQRPKLYPVLKSNVRRCLFSIFPYGILYSIEEKNPASDSIILIIAIMHCSRKPTYWKNRIKN